MNCKPGDLAILVKANYPENIGIVLMVDEVCPFYGLGHWRFTIRSARRMRTPLGQEIVACSGSIPDAHLRPITGLPIDEDVTEDLKEPA